MGRKKRKLPKKILLYQEDGGDDTLFIAVKNVSDIPDYHSGESVGEYILNKSYKFKVKRELA
jgi:hypothetical protein